MREISAPSRMLGGNRMKLGLFGQNCNGGLTMTKAPESWNPSWENNVKAAKLADEAGLEFVLPIARWLGYKGETDTEGTVLETLTWAAGLLASTTGVSIFGTLHVGLIHPVFAAKQIVTNHHIGGGRFGLNMVSGWNEGEYAMFNVELLEHDERYVYTAEWIDIARKIWTCTEPFDHNGKYFNLKGVLSKPKPFAGDTPLLMSAGSSGAGRAFAIQNADCLFMAVIDIDKLPQEVAKLRADAARNIGTYTSGHIFTRPTAKEAKEFYDYIVHENGDWEGAEHIVNVRISGGGRSVPPEIVQQMKERHMAGIGSLPLVGSYDEVAAILKQLHDAGLDGVAVGLVDYVSEFPHLRDGILPRLERMGLREPYRAGRSERK